MVEMPCRPIKKKTTITTKLVVIDMVKISVKTFI